MASKTVSGKVWIGSGGQSTENTVYGVQDDAITLPPKTTTATFKANVNTSGYLKNYSASQKNITLYLCDSSGNNAVNVFSRAISGGGTVTSDTTSKSVNLSGLAGKKLYGKVVSDGNNSIKVHNYFAFSLTYTYTVMTAVVQGDSCVVADRSQTGTTTTQGASMSDSHFSAGTEIKASTFNSNVLGL